MTREALKKTIWEDLDLETRSLIFCCFDTEYGTGIGNSLIETTDDLFDDYGWYDFCVDNLPNTPSVTMTECVTYMLGDGEADHASGDDIDYLADIMRDHPRMFSALLDECADVLSIIRNAEAPNPAYDVLGIEEDEQ